MDIAYLKKRFPLLMLIFAFGGIFGFIYEEIFYRFDLGEWVKRGTTFGPWIPIYGFGCLLIHSVDSLQLIYSCIFDGFDIFKM